MSDVLEAIKALYDYKITFNEEMWEEIVTPICSEV
jgi:hypothetical protein